MCMKLLLVFHQCARKLEVLFLLLPLAPWFIFRAFAPEQYGNRFLYLLLAAMAYVGAVAVALSLALRTSNRKEEVVLTDIHFDSWGLWVTGYYVRRFFNVRAETEKISLFSLQGSSLFTVLGKSTQLVLLMPKTSFVAYAATCPGAFSDEFLSHLQQHVKIKKRVAVLRSSSPCRQLIAACILALVLGFFAFTGMMTIQL